MRALLRLAAIAAFAAEAAGTHLWIREHGTVAAAARHAWAAVTSDWMAVVFFADLVLIALVVLAWLARDTRGLPAAKRAAWLLGTLLIGSPVLFLYLSQRRPRE